MKQKILNHTSIMIILTVLLTFVAASFVMYGKFDSVMKTGVRNEAEYVKVGLEEAGTIYLNEKVGQATDTRITLTDKDGNVLYDSEADASLLPNHSDRPEFIQAMDNYIKVFLSSHMTPDNITYIFSLNGVKKFLDTGRVSEYPYDIYHPLEMTDRIHLIRKLMLNLPIQNYRVLKKDIGHLDNEIFLLVTQPMGYIMFSTPQDHHLIYLDIEEPGLLYTFWDFCETLDDTLFYTTTEAIEILRDLIEQYKELR